MPGSKSDSARASKGRMRCASPRVEVVLMMRNWRLPAVSTAPWAETRISPAPGTTTQLTW